MLRSLLIISFLLLIFMPSKAQPLPEAPRVSRTLQFANMRLHLTEKARQDIQADVDALYRSPKYLWLKLERIDLYMPIIEPILAENKVPEDFKYLVIQESALIADAVSSSNAVGFWQFKDYTAAEYGLRVDRQIDERMNIVSATKGATRYLRKSNDEFDNWLYSLLSYNIGLGGAMRSLDKSEYGAREMRIDHDTHWYIKKFLSHKVALEPILGKTSNKLMLYAYTKGAEKSLRDIANEFQVEEDAVEAYNKWLRTSRIPSDRTYTVIVPLKVDEAPEMLATTDQEVEEDTRRENSIFGKKQRFPMPERKANYTDLRQITLNGLSAVIAKAGDSQQALAKLGEISLSKFQRYNEISLTDGIEVGQVYYYQRKRGRARVYEHVLKPGETLWQVAQQYGVRENKLRQKNRLRKDELKLQAGRVLWLRFIRPRSKEIEYREFPPMPQIQVVEKKTMSETLQVEASEEVKAEAPLVEVVEVGRQASVEETPEMIAEKGGDTPDLPLWTDAEEEEVEDIIEEEVYGEDIQLEGPEETSAVSRKVIAENRTIPVSNGTAVASITRSEDVTTFAEVASIIHEVRAGETLYGLSKKYEVEVSELIRWNNLPTQPVLSIGQQLVIKKSKAQTSEVLVNEIVSGKQLAPDNQSEEAVYHTVVAGESMYRVARQYAVTIKDIMQWNKKDNFNVKVGERLIVGFAGNESAKKQQDMRK